MMMAEGREERARISLLACWRFFHMSVTAILDLWRNAGSTWIWMSERRAKRLGSVETARARSQEGARIDAEAASEPFRKVRLVGFSVIGITFLRRNALPPRLKRYSDFRQQFNGVVVIEFLQA